MSFRLASPTLAYNFSELIEAHAVDTYTEFAESNKELLQRMAAPSIAKEYYENVDMYMFDEFQTNSQIDNLSSDNIELVKSIDSSDSSKTADAIPLSSILSTSSPKIKPPRRPKIQSLYDVFANICMDENAHVRTMSSCQNPDTVVQSPNTEAAIFASSIAIAIIVASLYGTNLGSSVDGSEGDIVSLSDKLIDNAGVTMDDILKKFQQSQSLTSGLSEGNTISTIASWVLENISKLRF